MQTIWLHNAEHRAQTLAEAALVFVKPTYDSMVEKLRITFKEAKKTENKVFKQTKPDAKLNWRKN